MSRAAGVALMGLVAIVVVGCGGATSTSIADPTAAIEIYSQKDPGVEDLLRQQIADFENLHKTITVKVVHFGNEQLRVQFQSSAAAGVGPELVYGSNINLAAWVRLKIIQPVDPLMGTAFIKQFADNAVGSVTYKGHVYAVPDINGGHLMLIYNKKLATASALSEATGFIWPPNNSDDLIKTARSLTDLSKNQHGLVFNESDPLWLVPWIGGFDGAVLDSNNRPTLNTQSMIDALTFERSLKTLSALPSSIDDNTADLMFKAGHAAFIINGDWSVKGYADAFGSYLGIAPLPLVGKTGKWAAPYTAAMGYSVNARAKGDKLRAAELFLRYISQASQDVKVAALGYVPANTAATKDPHVENDPILGASSHALVHGTPTPIVPEMSAIWDAIRGQLADVMSGNEDPVAAAAAMQKDAERRLSQLNS
jgi:arabinogalactan oligomer/maltooligosaccharide transport system substrate-binding protein